MDRDELLDFLQKEVKKVLGDEDVVITPKTKLSSIAISSFGLVQLVCNVEEAFDIEIKNDEIRSFKTVKDIINYLEKQIC